VGIFQAFAGMTIRGQAEKILPKYLTYTEMTRHKIQALLKTEIRYLPVCLSRQKKTQPKVLIFQDLPQNKRINK